MLRRARGRARRPGRLVRANVWYALCRVTGSAEARRRDGEHRGDHASRQSGAGERVGGHAPDMTDDIVLETRNLSKSFRGFLAVNNVNLRVARGTIHALIGPNGAGKTTVFNLLTNFLAPSAGSILYEGSDITGRAPARHRAHGHRALVPDLRGLSASDGAGERRASPLQRRRGPSFHLLALRARVCDRFDDEAMALLDAGRPGRCSPTCRRSSCPTGASARWRLRPRWRSIRELMLLDEPTQGMGHEDIGRIVALIRRVAEGRTVLMVEHNLVGRRRSLRPHHGAAARRGAGRGRLRGGLGRPATCVEAYLGTADG